MTLVLFRPEDDDYWLERCWCETHYLDSDHPMCPFSEEEIKLRPKVPYRKVSSKGK